MFFIVSGEAEMIIENPDAGADGTSWREERFVPENAGRELTQPSLVEALLRKRPRHGASVIISFAPAEFEALGVGELHRGDYVRAGGSYFTPDVAGNVLTELKRGDFFGEPQVRRVA